MAILTIPSDAELAEFVDAYSLGQLTEARGINAGTVNTSYALELGAGRYFLRIYEEQDATGARREAAVLTHLAGHGVLTPAPVVARDGAAMRILSGKPAALFPWVDGDMLCQRSVTPASAEIVGAALARVHLAGHAPGLRLDEGRFSPEALVVRSERIADSKDAEARAMGPALREGVARFAKERRRDVPRGLVHGDLFRDNILWNVEPGGQCSSIAALLDFESAHDGPFAYDVAVTLLSWSYGSTFDHAVAAALVRGYRSVRELDASEREVLFDEALFACLRFTITRITDDAIRVGKKWQRFLERREALERLGRAGFSEALAL
jgi:homoserine kinase type II